MTEILNQDAFSFIESNTLIVLIVLAWSLVWKGIALWKAARLSHKWWFIIILIANTIGILEIVYIYFVAKKYKVESKESN